VSEGGLESAHSGDVPIMGTMPGNLADPTGPVFPCAVASSTLTLLLAGNNPQTRDPSLVDFSIRQSCVPLDLGHVRWVSGARGAWCAGEVRLLRG